MRTILCPLEIYAEHAAPLVEYATGVATKLDARLKLVHVFDLPAFVHPDLEASVARRYEEEAVQERERKLEELRAPYPDVEVETAVVLGVPYRKIVEIVGEEDIDLIVMGTHARKGLTRILLGSVAERVLRTAGIPVWTVPTTGTTVAHPSPTSILCSHDFSEASMRALELTRDLKKPFHAGVTALHVLPEELEAESPFRPGWLQPAQQARYRDALGRELERDIDDVFGPGAQAVQAKTAHGVVIDQIVQAQEESGADLMILGASGKNAVERFLLGSTTVDLLRRSAVPVITVP